MKIVTIVGSIRKCSLNRQLAETMKERYINKMDMYIADIKFWNKKEARGSFSCFFKIIQS